MLKKTVALVLSVILCLTIITGCHRDDSGGNGAEYPVTVGSVTFKSQPQKVAILCDSTADIILAASLENTLVCRSDECTQPELAVLPSVGSKAAPDANKIINYETELVFADDSLSSSIKQKLENSGVTVLQLSPAKNRIELQQLYKTIGSVLAGQTTGGKQAETAIDSIFTTFDDLNSTLKSDSDKTMTACYIIDEEFSTVNLNTFGNELIKCTNVRNVAESPDVSLIDNIKLANPQFIFCNTGLKATIESDERFADVTAVKEENVYELSYENMTRQGQTMIDCVIFMAKKMYPHLATGSSEVDPDNPSESGNESAAGSGYASAVENPIPEGTTLTYGEENDYVLEMQKRLDELGYMYYEPTGYYGASTQQSVSDFQLYNYDNLTEGVTGIASPETLELLFSARALKRPEPLR